MPEKYFSQPSDNSLQACKDWVSGIAAIVSGGAAKDTLTEEQWIEKWKSFWSKAEQSALPDSEEE